MTCKYLGMPRIRNLQQVESAGQPHRGIQKVQYDPNVPHKLEDTLTSADSAPPLLLLSPPAGGLTHGHAPSSDLFVIETAVAARTIAAVFAPPLKAAPSAAVLTAALSSAVVNGGYRSDPVIEEAELGYGTVWSALPVPDTDPSTPAHFGTRAVTLPALASHTFALIEDPGAVYAMQGIPAFTLYGGRWALETPYETTQTLAVDQLAGSATFLATQSDQSVPSSRYIADINTALLYVSSIYCLTLHIISFVYAHSCLTRDYLFCIDL